MLSTPSSAPSSGVIEPSSVMRSIRVTSWPVNASVCAAKASKFGFLCDPKKAADALIDMRLIRRMLEFRIEKPAQLENRRKTIFDDGERFTRLRRPAPCEIE
jgi:hypothetical protein